MSAERDSHRERDSERDGVLHELGDLGLNGGQFGHRDLEEEFVVDLEEKAGLSK